MLSAVVQLRQGVGGHSVTALSKTCPGGVAGGAGREVNGGQVTSRPARTAAFTAAVLSTATVPVALAATGLWVPELPSLAVARQWIAQPMSVGLVIVLAAAAAVMLWLLLATAILAQAYAALARRLCWAPAFRLPGPLQGLTAALLGATAVTTATGTTAHASPATTTSSDLPAGGPATATPSRHHAGPDPRPAEPAPTYTVRRGDSLCRIAERTLGDADRWPEIFALNRGTHFPTVGGTLRNPNLIYPGWTLALPADAAAPPTPHPPRKKADDHAPHHHALPGTSPATPPPPAADNKQKASAPGSATTAPGSSAAAPHTSSGETTGPAASATSRPAEQASRGVRLPSGSWVNLGLALAVVATVALVWAHRQRRYIPRALSARARLDDPELAPMPRVVGQIRRALRHAAASGADQPTAGGAGEAELRDEEPERRDGVPVDVGDNPIGALNPAALALSDPLSPRWPPAGLGLTGPGAVAAARGFLTTALAAGIDDPDARTQVLMPSGTAQALLGAAASLPRTPRLTVTADLDDALSVCEAQALHRARLLHQHDIDSVAALRAADPHEEPLPPLMLLADSTSIRQRRARITALLAQGHRLDIHGVLLGPWPDGDTIDVDADGTTTPADSDAHHLSQSTGVGRLTVLNPAETLDLLAALAESHTGQPPTFTPADPAPRAVSPRAAAGTAPAEKPPAISLGGTPHTPLHSPDTSQQNTDALNPHDAAGLAGREAGAVTGDTAIPADQPAPEDNYPLTSADTDRAGDTTGDRHHPLPVAVPEPTDTPALDTGQAPGRDRVEITVLGAPAIVGADPQRKPRAKALELLVYLAVCDGDASTEAILDDLLPDAPARKAVHRLHTYVSDLRAVLRHNAGPGTYLTRHHHRYQLNPDCFDIDLWRMRAAIRAADTAGTRAERITALRRAVTAYRPLAQGCDYEWLEPHRHAVQQEAINAVTALVEELADQPDQQAAVCETALQHHPYAETLYQQAMRAHARLGHPDTIRALRRTLTRRLADIDAEPCDDTLALADRLLADLHRPGRAQRNQRSSVDGASA